LHHMTEVINDLFKSLNSNQEAEKGKDSKTEVRRGIIDR
jgi:hypothetical protein